MTKLDTIRQRWAAVTPGPWRRAWHGTYEVEAPPNQLVADCGSIGRAKEDATAIAHAPDDIAYLLAEVERMRRFRARIASALGVIYGDADCSQELDAIERLRAALETTR
jgi:hypothetical protein